MASGLSELQKSILSIAFRNRMAGIKRHETADTVNAEILHEHFRFPLTRSVKLGGQQFDINKIGESKFREARASVSQAIKRLEDSGLVNLCWGITHRSGVVLTDVGHSVAKELSAMAAAD
jgi:hypothetical protein